MAKFQVNEARFLDSTQHQAVCTNDHFSGPLEDTEEQAETDAANHMAKPGNENHIVKIISVKRSVRNFTNNK